MPAHPLDTKSPAKLALLEFIRTCPANDKFIFSLNCNEEAANKFVHHMRVELSRLRGLVRASGATINPFKLRLESILPDIEDGTCQITLIREVNTAVNIDFKTLLPGLVAESKDAPIE